MTKILKSLIVSSTLMLCGYTSAATWQDVGTLANGSFPNPTCGNVRLAAPTPNAGVFNYIYPISRYQNQFDLNLEFSNYTIDNLQDFFINVPNNTWNSVYTRYQNVKQKYPNHVTGFKMAVYKNNNNVLVTTSMATLSSGNVVELLGNPINFISSHPYIKIQQLCI